VAGKVTKGSVTTLPNGRHVPVVPITSDEEQPLGGDELYKDFFGGDWPTKDVEKHDPKEIAAASRKAGLVGQGGAAFPTHVKLTRNDEKPIDTLLVNGCECEPYLTSDHRTMVERAADVLRGARIVARKLGAEDVHIGVEQNKLDAIDALRRHVQPGEAIHVTPLAVKYPQGAEKMLISALLGREVPSGGLPLDVHALCVNVATTAEIGRLLPQGRGIQERVITVTGSAVKRKGNYRIPIGTPLRFLLEWVGVTDDVSRVFLGGPMMGAAVPSLDVSITKGTSGVVAFTEREARAARPRVHPCIRCGYCVDACPMLLDPSQLGALARNEEYERMADEFHLMDCFECGSCSFVCPSHIPLVQQFRFAKARVRKARAKAS